MIKYSEDFYLKIVVTEEHKSGSYACSALKSQPRAVTVYKQRQE